MATNQIPVLLTPTPEAIPAELIPILRGEAAECGGGAIDAVPTDGSSNAVSSNGVFDALAGKDPAGTAASAAGLALGAAEANPLGLLTLPGKLIALEHAKTLPTGEREHALSVISSVWRGAAANNLCVVVAIATGGTFGPACAVAGLAVALREWESAAIERQFWAVCAWHRQTQPDLKCTYITTPA